MFVSEFFKETAKYLRLDKIFCPIKLNYSLNLSFYRKANVIFVKKNVGLPYDYNFYLLLFVFLHSFLLS